ncbi:MAG: hypothetical protein ACE5JD_12150, partial [Candidatus Methylomirabilia bacterium]
MVPVVADEADRWVVITVYVFYTVRLTEDVAIDLGMHEEIIGIEILDASKHLGIDKAQPICSCASAASSRIRRVGFP